MLKTLSTVSFRGLEDQTLVFSDAFNVFMGKNGSGKTSLLEAFYYLCTQKSFRTSKPHYLIQQDQPELFLRGTFALGDLEETVAFQRDRQGKKTFQRKADVEAPFLAWARLVPVLFMDTASHRELADTPSVRRHLLDWTLFHIDEPYALEWKNFQRILKQRNAALKTQDASLDYWDHALVEASKIIDEARERCCVMLGERVQTLLDTHHALGSMRFAYDRGWPKKKSYEDVLMQNRRRDQASGYTHWGPHRADILITCDNTTVSEALSQGQMKMLHMFLRLAQHLLVEEATGRRALFLIDDLLAELDTKNGHHMIRLWSEYRLQVMLTRVQSGRLVKTLFPKNTSYFQVDEGAIAPLTQK